MTSTAPVRIKVTLVFAGPALRDTACGDFARAFQEPAQ